jgi:Rad3-related DNA helicase
MSIFDFTPDGFNIDHHKKRILEDVQKEIKKGTKYISLEAPTGIGKSWIAATIALWRKDSCILTPDKKLQDQYGKNFSNFMTVVKGKNSFNCLQLDNQKTCVYGNCKSLDDDDCKFLCNQKDFQIDPDTRGTKNEKITLLNNSEDVCEYWKQRVMGELSSFSVYNYDMFVSTQLIEPEFEKESFSRFRDVLICDEAEQLEDKLSHMLTMELTIDDLNILPNSDLKFSFDKIDDKTSLTSVLFLIDTLISELENELKLQNQHMKCSRYLNSLEHIHLHSELSCEKHPKKRQKTCTGNCKKSFDFVKNSHCYNCKDHAPLNRNGDVCSDDHSRFNQIKQKEIESKINNFKNKLVQINNNLDDYSLAEITFDSQNKKIIIVESINVSKIAQKIFNQFNHVIFISSTINNESFLKSLGIVNTSVKPIKEFVIPYERYRVSTRKVIFESTTTDETKKVLNSPELFYKFEFEGSYFYANLDEFIPKNSKLFRNENNKIGTYPVSLEDVESIKIMNSKNSSFYQTYPNPIHRCNREIICDYVGHIAKYTKDDLMPKIVKKIEDILDDHPNDKGIIHVTSWEYQKNILEKISKKHASRFECVIDDEDYFDKKSVQNIQKFSSIDALLDSHKKSQGSVILSPSCWYGVDLADELSRFQIIVKAPFLPLTNAVKKKRLLESGNDWYQTKAAYKLVQGCGRSIRNTSDFATTYLLDSNCGELLKNRHVRPWFVDSIKKK